MGTSREHARGAVLVVGVLLLAVGPALAGPRRHLAPGLGRDDDTLVIESTSGDASEAVQVDVGGWEAVPDAGADVIALARKVGDQREIRVLDRRGRTLSTYAAPREWIPAGTDGGIVLVPEALHAPMTAHTLRFLSYEGELRREVHEPTLLLRVSRIMPGGHFVTLSSTGARDREWTVLAYDASGTEIWRHVATGDTPPEALVTMEGRRLVVLERDLRTGVSLVTVFSTGRRPKTYRLPMVGRLVADPGAARVAAVGERIVALIDTRSRKLVWQRDEAIDVPLHGGVRFDRRAPRLFVVSAEEDRRTRQARLRLHTYRLSDGAGEHVELGDAPLDRLPPVVDVEGDPEGGRRVLLHDRAVTATPERPTPR